MTAALEAGRVDAALVTEPFTTAARKSGRVIASGFDYIAKHFLITTWCTTTQWAKDHPDLVSRFAAVMHESAVWANQNPDKSGEILVRHTKIDAAALPTMSRSHYSEMLAPSTLQPLIDVSAKYNGFAAFPAQDLIYVPQRG
jgi:NitT/TauT family transport system substrate-binding protein